MKALEFYLITLPGFEDLALHEFGEWFPGLEAKAGHGGLTVEAPLETGLSFNLALKIPTRVLLRVARFRCRDFPKLFQKISQFDWSKWLEPNANLEVEVSVHRSRLKMKKRIADTCLDAWKKTAVARKAAGKNPPPVKLFVRIQDDECTLSLDTSGERLHKRGARTHVGEAPLRETIAAALFHWTANVAPETRAIEIVDPMMGSGTFLLEAATHATPADAREFPFTQFKCGEIATPERRAPELRIAGGIGFEADAPTAQAAQNNFRGLKNPPRIQTADLFKADPLPEASGARWLFANPPYGERLTVEKPFSEYYAGLFAASERLARPDRACFLLPAKAVRGERFVLPGSWKVLEKRGFSNGGIPVVAFLFGRNRG